MTRPARPDGTVKSTTGEADLSPVTCARLVLDRDGASCYDASMALTAYARLRILWGAFDFSTDSEAPAYNAATTVNGGGSGEANLRRMVIRWSRSVIAEDDQQTSLVLGHVSDAHELMDFDTAQFTAAEAAFDTFWATVRPRFRTSTSLSEYRWYREGPGATPPEPTVRVTPRSSAGTSANDELPGQLRNVVSLRTALRKRWGRCYLPTPSSIDMTANGHLATVPVDTLAGAAHALAGDLAAANLAWFVYSPTMARGYQVERVWVDDVYDVQRSGRVTMSYHKAYPVP